MLRDASERTDGKNEDGLFKVLGSQPVATLKGGPNLVSISSGQLEGSAANAMETMVQDDERRARLRDEDEIGERAGRFGRF